jgi:hypothetical protein
MKEYGGSGCIDPHFLDLGTIGGEWSASHRGCFTPGERALCTHWIEGWVDPRAGLDGVEKRKFFSLPGIKHRSLCRPARGVGGRQPRRHL